MTNAVTDRLLCRVNLVLANLRCVSSTSIWSLVVGLAVLMPGSRSEGSVINGFSCSMIASAVCLQQHRDAQTANTLDACKEQYALYDFGSRCEKLDRKCWKNLEICDRRRITKKPPQVPSNFRVINEDDPYVVTFRWDALANAVFYLLQYKDDDDVFASWNRYANSHETTNLYYHFNKPNLCPSYSARVAAVNSAGISEFTLPITVQSPPPVFSKLNYWVTNKRVLDIPYNYTRDGFASRTIEVAVHYDIPRFWKPSDLSVQDSDVVMIACRYPEICEMVGHHIVNNAAEQTVIIKLPDSVLKCECEFMYSISSFMSKCGVTYDVSEMPVVGSTLPGVTFFTGCDSVANSGCSEREPVILPSCAIKAFNYTVTGQSPDAQNETVNMTWTIESSYPDPSQLQTLYYLIKYDLVQSENQDQPVFSPKVLKNLGQLKTTTNSASLYDLVPGNKYAVHICAVYNGSNASDISWKISGWKEIEIPRVPIAAASEDTPYTVLLSALVPLSVSLVVAALAVWTVLRCKRERLKSLAELASEQYRVISTDGRYVLMPTKTDQWETPRSKLLVYDDQKLGSGAFGAVYKGKIEGRLLTHKDINSVLAEKRISSENCEVAVKMLPEYADEAAKSDFRKEINLMKNLGQHERLVNILGCITIDEPLCLIVEYCPDGDLLHYLRDRRKYMISLEERGINLQDVDNPEVDLDMILCLKDLMSFSWQVSVGMEYLSQKKFIHRDVAARNMMVDGKKIKIGDFGLCRYVYSDPVYMSKGGRLPVKWMALEAIKSYEFTTKSDVWSFGVLLFEIITLGGSPYPGIQPSDMEKLLQSGKRMDKPENCPDDLYLVMLDCWWADPDRRPSFSDLREQLRCMLEKITEDYSYLGLDPNRDYYNVIGQEDDRDEHGQQHDEQPPTNGTPDEDHVSIESPTKLLQEEQERPLSGTLNLGFVKG